MGIDFRQRRKELGYSVDELSEKSGVSRGTIKNIEARRVTPRSYNVEAIAKALDLDITYRDYYMELHGKKENSSDEISQTDKNVEDKLSKADKLYFENKYEEALNIYLSLAIIFDKDRDFLFRCGLIYQALSEYEKAIEYCDKILHYDEENFNALELKGECLGQMGNTKESLEVFNKAAKIEENGATYYNMGFSCQRDNYLKAAIKYYEKCIEISPNFESAYTNMAICYNQQFQAEKAMEYAKKAIEINPNLHEAYATLGSAYKEMSNYEEAVINYKKCLELDENNYEALLNIFICLGVMGKGEEAEFYYDKCFRVHADKIFGRKKLEKDLTYVGYTHLKDDTGSMDYPTLGKVYMDKEKYLEDINNIKKSVSVLQYFDKPIYFTNDYVKVNVVALEKSTLIEIVFGDFSILEVNVEEKDLATFINLYEKYNQFRIQLEWEGEIFAIDCIKNISFKI